MKLKQFIFALVAMLSGFAFTANAQTAVSSFDELKAALANSTDIVVNGDIAVDEAITIPSGTTVAGDGTLRVQTKVYVVSTENPYPGVTYNKTATKNGSISGTASCAVVYEISLDGGENWFTDTTNGKAQAVTVKTDGTKSISTSFQSAFTSAKCGEIVHMLKDAHVQSTNSKKNNGPLRSYYGLILEGNGHTIYTDVESSGASNDYSTIKFTSYLAGTGADVRPVLKNVTIDSQKNAKADLDIVSGDVTFTVSLFNVNLLGKCVYASFPITSSSLVLNKSNVKLFDSTIPSWDAGSANAIEFYSGDYSLSFNGKCKVYGGSFSKDATKYLADRAEMSTVNGKYVVTCKEEKVEAAPSVGTAVEGEVANEIVANEAVANNSVELPADVANFTVQLTAVESENEATTKVTFTVTPSNVLGEKVSTPTEAITFRLPVPAAWSGKAKVYHNGAELGVYDINEENGAKYVEVTSANFSEFAVEQAAPVVEVNGTGYASFADAAAAAQAGSEIKLLANIEGDITVPAGVIFNGNGFAVSGAVTAAGEITFAGVTKVGNFGVQYVNTTVNIPAGASLELTGTGRMVIGHGCTFNITGTIENAKTADKATLTPSLVMPGASFTGAGVTFNVTNAYIKVPSSYCSTSKSASGTFDFNITNSIWESAGKLAFEEQSVNAKVDFALVNSVLTTGSHLVFGTASGEEGGVVIDNSLVNEGASRQLENCGTMTIKNGSVVNGAVATSSNAKNPGTVIVENATYAVTGEFSGSDLGTGTLIIKKGATVSVGSIKAGANVTVDAEGMTAGDEINFTANLSQFTGTLSVINNDKLEAQIVDGKVVLAAKPVAKIGEQGYATLEAAFAAATEGQTITLLDDATPALTSQRAITKAAVIDLGGKTLTLTEDDLYFGTTTFKNGTIVVDPSVKPSTAVFWMFANQTLTFNNVKIVATGVTGTYLIGLEGDNSDLNLLNGSEILVENTTVLDLDIICVNGTNTCDINVDNSKVNVTNLDGRVFFRGNYTVKDSEVNLAGITKAGFRIEAGQTLSIEGTSKVNIEGEPRDGGIHMTDLTATYTKAETATVNATVNEPKVAKVGENTYRTLAQAVAAVEDGGTITLIANEIFTKTNRTHNSGTWYDGLYYVGDKSFTIDLGGFTISQDGAVNDYLLNFKNSGSKANTITLKNGTLDAGTAAFCAICTSSSQANELTINTEKLNIINNISNGSTVKVRGGAVLNVNDGTVITGKNSYLGIECVASTVNIYDGAKIYMNGTTSYNGCLVGACGGGTVNVYGGYGKGAKGGFIAMTSGGTINISGGEWIANTDGTVGNNSNLYVLTAQSNIYEQGFVGPAIINVTGGTFRGGMDAWVLNNHKDEKAELNIKGGNFNANPTSYVAADYIAVENSGVWTVVKAAAKVGEQGYATLEEAFKAATSGCTIEILSDVTVDYNWDARKTGAKFTVPVTINGNGKTIKFTASVNDNNYQAPFRFEADATVKKLTIDMSEVTDNRFRAISSKGNLTVDGCKFIGKDKSLNCRAIIFGEGAGANVGNLAIAITNSEFINWKRGITDNENAQDVKTVTITGNTLTDAGVGVSAKETVTFTGNTVSGAYVNIKSYTAGNKLAVTATGNTLEANTETAYNVINAGGKVNAEGFNVVAEAKIGETYYATLADAIAASTPETGWGGEVTLLKDVTLEGGYADASEGLRIEKSVTINGGGYTIDCGTFTKGIRIYQNGDKASNVMFKHTNIVNNNNQGRCIDTRSGKINLMLNGFVNLTAHGTNSQPLTIGGSEAMTKVTISGGTIDAGTSGYAVICFVPVTNHINVQGNAVIKGLAAFYLKEGVTNTAIKLSQSTSIGTNKNAAASGDFGAIVIEGSNNSVRLEHSGAVVKAVAADGAEMAAQAAFLLRGNNNTVGYYNNTNAQVVTEGGQAYWTMSNADVTGTKYERNGVEMLLEAETRGYQFITVEDALRYAKNGDTVKLLANAELDETYVNEKSLTLDLNGKTLSTAYVAGSTTNHLYAIQNNAELTITDSSDAKDGKISARGNFNYGTLTLEAGTIEAIDGNGGYAVRNYAGSFTMNGGTIATTLEDDHQVNNGGYDATTVRVDEGATFTMNGGELNNICDYTFAIENYGTTTVNGGKATSVHSTVSNYGTMTINGGSFTCNGLEGITAHALVVWDGSTTTINDGTFDGKDNYNGFNVYAAAGADVVIKGGEFRNVHSGSLYGEGTITVSAGTFFDKIDDARCVVGYQAVANENGTYTVEYTGKRAEVTIVDGEEFVNANELSVGKLTYKRELWNDLLWNPLYVPFEIPVSELTAMGLEVAYFNDVHSYDDDKNGSIDRMTMEAIKLTSGKLVANHPYMFRRVDNNSVTEMNLELENVKLYSSNKDAQISISCSSAYTSFEINGTYNTMTAEELGNRLIIDENGNWTPMDPQYNLNPFRLHLEIKQKNGSPVVIEEAAKRSIGIRLVGEENEDGTTTIYDVNAENGEDMIYDLSGRRVLETEKGIYIINGKKVLVK